VAVVFAVGVGFKKGPLYNFLGHPSQLTLCRTVDEVVVRWCRRSDRRRLLQGEVSVEVARYGSP